MLVSAREVEQLIEQGTPFIAAGDESLLRTLPPGTWIGGTIPYFMTDRGGVVSRDRLFVQKVPAVTRGCRITTYDVDTIAGIAGDSPEHGYTILIIPAFTPLHESYAMNAPAYPDLFFRVIAGWIAGVHLDDLEKTTPKVFSGSSREVPGDTGVAMHVELPPDYRAEIGIVNIFDQGPGDDISFPESGFAATDCVVNGERRNFYDYFVEHKLDSRLPLVADFFGTRINVSIQALDNQARRVRFFAPVFDGVTYRMASPVASYPEQFWSALPVGATDPAFSCNCVLNFLYGGLEGRRAGATAGPMTFGEIGYQLLNQTLVYVKTGRAL